MDDIPIVGISLDRRPDRWASLSNYAAAAGIQIQRISAIDAKNFEAHKHPAVSLLTAHNILNGTRRSHYEIDRAGAVGCSLSHFKAWEYLTNSTAQAIVIFEDDSPIPVDFKMRLASLLNELPAQGAWDMVTFYRTPFGGGLTGCKPDVGNWQSCTSLMGAHAYMLSRRGAARLLSHAYPIEMHVDAYMAYMARMDHIKMLWNPIMQIAPNLDDSDINHGDNGILNIPSNMEKHGVVALKLQSVVGLMAMAAVAGGILTIAYAVKLRK
jgi:GR25 family glycosyltransferase involved in LPS biosynthesis